MKKFFLVLFAIFATPVPMAQAEEVIPDSRFVVSRDTDFFGGDLSPIFETNLGACIRACTLQDDCTALTFNTSAKACFPKRGVERKETFEGAISAKKIALDAEVLAQAAMLRASLSFVTDEDIEKAVKQAREIGFRYPAGDAALQDLIGAGRRAMSEGRIPAALGWIGAAISVGDDAGLWNEYAGLRLDLANTSRRERRAHLEQSSLAAVNAYLRGRSSAVRAEAMRLFAMAMEESGKGRLMIDALRLAADLHPRRDIEDMLDDAIGKYGFRVVATRVESDTAAPRICTEFSEDLTKVGVDYSTYTRLPDVSLAVVANERELCIEGVRHGERYRVTFRSGLPAASGEALVRDIEVVQYVRDRSPQVRFSGRSYVLSRSGDIAVPVESVNASLVSLELYHVSDRNILAALRDGYVGRPLWGYEQEYLSQNLATKVWEGELEVQSTLNEDTTTRIPLSDALRNSPTGIYALKAVVPNADPYDDPASIQWFVLSDIGLSVFHGNEGISVQAASLSNAKPLGNVRLTLVSAANAVLGHAETDAQGLALFPAGLSRGSGSASPALIMSEHGEEDIGFLSLTEPAFDLSDRGVVGRSSSGSVDVFAALDRGAYRVGETVHAVALVRDAITRAVAGVPLTAVIFRPDGVEHGRFTSTEDVEGGHVFHFGIPQTAQRGAWRIEFAIDAESDALASQKFLVEDFLPERIDVSVTPPPAPVQQDAEVFMPVSARYLFGAPGAGLDVAGDISMRPVRRVDSYPGYLFGRHDSSLRPYSGYVAGTVTDTQGTGVLSVELPEMEDVYMPFDALATVRVREGSGRPVERQVTFPVRPAADLVGIHPLFDGDLPEGGEAVFDVIGLNATLQPIQVEMNWTVNRIHTRYQWYELYGDWKWEPITRRERIATGTINANDLPGRIQVPVEWGEYELVVERSDGTYAEASVDFSAGWYASEGSDTPDTLDVALDKPGYRVGDTAALRVVSRRAGTAFVTVMSDQVIARDVVALPEGESIIPVKVTEAWGAGAYVTVSLVAPVSANTAHGPVRQLGLAHATIDPGEKALSLQISAPETMRPRGNLVADLTVEGLEEGQTAYVTLAAVDLGILNLTGFKVPNPQSHYFGQRQLGVELRDIYGRLIDSNAGAMGRVRSGGDANAGPAFDAPPPTEDLMAVFEGPVQVGTDGQVRIEVPVGDFNGTVRLMAIVWSENGVGQADRDVIVRDPVVMTASLPRFLAPGDRSRMLLEITHAEGPVGPVGLVFASAGIQLGNVASEIVLEEQARVALAVDLEAGQIGDNQISVYMTLPEGEIIRKDFQIGVRSNDAEISTTRRLRLGQGETLTLDDEIFDGLRAGTGHALVSAGPLARLDAAGLLSELDRYPYGCTEQVTSVAMPFLYLSSVAQSVGLGARTEIDRRIATAISLVLSRQASNGSFGLWRPMSGDLWLDSYVTDFLSRAQAEGHSVPERAFDMALDNLMNRVNYASNFDWGGEDIAYALFVLAREGKAAMSDLRYYADEKADAFATPLARAQIGAALANYGDQMRADALFRKAAILLDDDTERSGWRDDYGTKLRDRAGLLTLVAESGSSAVDAEELAHELMLSGQSYRSTQEAAWTLLASHALIRAPQTTLEVNGAVHDGPFVRVLAGSVEPMAFRGMSVHGTDITLTTFGVPEISPKAGGTHYQIERAYFDLDGVAIKPDEVTQGARLVVVLTVKAIDERSARLMIDDPLPAGFEIDNPNILRSGDLSALEWLELDFVENAEFRSDRFLAAVDLRGADAVRVAYQVRAISPGVFHHPAAVVEDMYRPQERGWTDTGQVRIVAK